MGQALRKSSKVSTDGHFPGAKIGSVHRRGEPNEHEASSASSPSDTLEISQSAAKAARGVRGKELSDRRRALSMDVEKGLTLAEKISSPAR